MKTLLVTAVCFVYYKLFEKGEKFAVNLCFTLSCVVAGICLYLIENLIASGVLSARAVTGIKSIETGVFCLLLISAATPLYCLVKFIAGKFLK